MAPLRAFRTAFPPRPLPAQNNAELLMGIHWQRIVLDEFHMQSIPDGAGGHPGVCVGGGVSHQGHRIVLFLHVQSIPDDVRVTRGLCGCGAGCALKSHGVLRPSAC